MGTGRAAAVKRGDIVLARARGTLANKARPCMIVQNDASLGKTHFVNVCPITSHVRGADLIRVVIAPTGENGLARLSEIEVDLVTVVEAVDIDRVVGCADAATIEKVSRNLRRWLHL